MASFRDDEAVLLGETGVFDIAVRLVEGGGVFLVPGVRQALVVEKRRQVVLEALVADGATKVVAGPVDEIVEFLRALHSGTPLKA